MTVRRAWVTLGARWLTFLAILLALFSSGVSMAFASSFSFLPIIDKEDDARVAVSAMTTLESATAAHVYTYNKEVVATYTHYSGGSRGGGSKGAKEPPCASLICRILGSFRPERGVVAIAIYIRGTVCAPNYIRTPFGNPRSATDTHTCNLSELDTLR